MKFIDISRDVMTAEVFKGDPAPKLERVQKIDENSEYNLSKISMCLHNGTHMDAPLHFLPDGNDICTVPPDAFFGPCVVVEVPPILITGSYVEEYFPRNTKRVLIKSGGKAFLHESAASELSYMGYYLVGTDALTVEPEGSDGRSHRMLMLDNIAVLENLDLDSVSPGDYFLSAAPIKISGAEAAPVRAILISDYIFWSGDNQ
ncbi:MAG: cyclase family protein [Oscillospiraceae bacterium]|nr:cyclase family protein [Oscillospiraceae bacterium]